MAGSRMFSNFFAGFLSHFRGAWLIMCHSRLLAWALIPMVITFWLLVGVLVAVHLWLWGRLGEWLGAQESWWQGGLRWLLVLTVCAVTLVLVYMIFLPLRRMVAAPFNDVLSLRSEPFCRLLRMRVPTEAAKGSVHGEGAVRSVVRSIIDTMRLMAAEYLAYLVCSPLFFIPFAGVLIFWIVRSYYAGINALDIALTCRGFTYAEKKAIFKSDRARMFGLGLGAALFDMTVVLTFCSLPASVVGGTLVYVDLESMGRLTRQGTGPAQIEA